MEGKFSGQTKQTKRVEGKLMNNFFFFKIDISTTFFSHINYTFIHQSIFLPLLLASSDYLYEMNFGIK